ncbi:Rv3654c family TadE-like protein [Streptosporangium sandarakinum]|uniref:Rv3654c family TadE-like protein n=1 Tax=Streptosporangium sandarakinum TaxID=1260955 RepID=UPI00369AE879
MPEAQTRSGRRPGARSTNDRGAAVDTATEESTVRDHGHEGGAAARSRAWRERGSATIWAIAVAATVWAVAAALMAVGAARVGRHRAQSAADLSALAAARLAFVVPDRGCARAEALARANGAEVTGCAVGQDGIADIQVTVRLSLPVLGPRPITALARAGPVYIAESPAEPPAGP